MMDSAYFQRWKNSNHLEKLHREFHAKTLLASDLDKAYKEMGYQRPINPYVRRTFN